MPVLLTTAAAGLALALAAAQGGSILLAVWHIARRRPLPPPPLPPISLIRPVCGLDPKDAETLGSSFGLDYPDYEILFCVADPADPAVALVERLMAAHPGQRARLLLGEDAISGNPKLNNVAKGWRAAGSDWIVMADSNLSLPPDYLSVLLAEMRPGIGMVSSPAYGTQAETAAAHLECAYLNTLQARWQIVADVLGQGYAQGKTLFYRRDVIEAAGGLAALGREMAEDVASTKITRAAGLRVALPPAPFPTPLGRRNFGAVWQRQVRWAKVRRMGFPALYLAEVLNGFAPFLALALLGGIPGDVILAVAILWYAAEWALAQKGDWPRGPLDVAMWVLRDALAPVLWVRGWIGQGFEWRGNAMQSDQTTGRP